MNGNQRVRKVLIGEWPDKRPILLHNFLMAAKEYGVNMKCYREDPEVIAKVHICAIEKYDLDGAVIDIDTATLAGAVGVPVDFPEDDPARVHQPLLHSIEQVNDLEPADISKNERIQIWLEACRIIKKHYGDEKFIRGNCDQAPFSLASMMRTPSEWMIDILNENENVFSLLNYCTNAAIQFIRLMSETGVDMVSNGDSPAGPEMISPEMYRKFAFPFEKKVIEEAHRLNKPYMLHICGNTNSIIDDMVKTGSDSIELDYKTDIYKIYDSCKECITFSGNIDPTGIIFQGTPDIVKRKTEELLTIYRDSPRLIINAGCAIPRDTPPENIFAICDAVKKFGI